MTVRDADLFHVAHQRLQTSLQQTGPATWTPSATVEPEWPEVTVHLANLDYADWD
jgi:hypothetical protein